MVEGQDERADIVEATAAYEEWVRAQIPLWEDDLEYKHEQMAAAPFPFLRATFYRWAQRWPRLCPEEAEAPAVPAIGDLHVENYATWRDSEARLVWGMNDFDEAAVMPYTMDLVRLATSARLALKAGHMEMITSAACEAIVKGYHDSLRAGGRPLVLAEDDRWLRQLATGRLRDPTAFWAKMERLPALDVPLRPELRKSLARRMPKGVTEYTLRRRRAGLGSLGHERVCAQGLLDGANVAREVKGLCHSAWAWASGRPFEPEVAERLWGNSVRDPDPYLDLRPTHLVRRLAPDCTRLELWEMPTRKDDLRLLQAMGWEAANVHLASPGIAEIILPDLEARPAGWLEDCARRMYRAVMRDWKAWRTAHRPVRKPAAPRSSPPAG